MVDTKNLTLVEIFAQHADDMKRAVQVVTDRLFDHDAAEMGSFGRHDQSGAMEFLDGFGDRLRRQRQVVDAVGRQTALSLDFLQTGPKPREAVRAIQSRYIIQAMGKALPARLVDLQPRVALCGLARLGAKRVGRHFAPREAEDCAFWRYRVLATVLKV